MLGLTNSYEGFESANRCELGTYACFRLTLVCGDTYHSFGNHEKTLLAGSRERVVGTFGERLRREREMRGIGLEEIATATKISTRNLKALEDEKFSQLPGGIFNKGFVRAYAKFLGIDEEQVVAEYETAAEQTENAREQKLRQELAKPEIKPKDEREINLEPKSQWGTIAVIVLIAVLAYSGYTVYQKKKAERAEKERAAQAAAGQMQQAQPVQTPPVTIPAEPAGPSKDSASPQTDLTPAQDVTSAPAVPAAQKNSSPTETAAKPADATTSPINLVIKVKEDTWMSVKADGKTLVSETLPGGTEKSFKANDKIEVVLGRAKSVEVSYNGKVLDDLKSGQDVRKLTFTPSGYE